MKNFISPIYIKTNPVSDEKICIGIFVGSEDKSFFAWSENKLKLSSKLTKNDVHVSLSKIFQNIYNDLESRASDISKNKIFIQDKYTFDYFNYLNIYNDGLLKFDEPTILPRAINSDQFKSLFKLYTGESVIDQNVSSEKHTFYQKVKSYLKNPAFVEKADVHYKVPEKIIETIYRPQLVDFISCNGNIFTGYSIDFTAGVNTIENKLYEFRALVDGLSSFAEKKKLKGKGKYIAYYESPKTEEQRNIFDNAYKDKTKQFEMKPVEELEEAANILREHEYIKFSEIS